MSVHPAEVASKPDAGLRRTGWRGWINNLVSLVIPDPNETRRYFSKVQDRLGGADRLKEVCLSDVAAHGVVAALLATIAVAILLLAPNNYAGGKYDDQAKYVLVISQFMALGAALACVNLCGQTYGCMLCCPPRKLIDFLATYKGRFYFESVLAVNTCVLLIMLGIVSLIYLLYGPILFLIAIGLGVVFTAHAFVVFNHFFLTLVRILESPDDDGESDAAGAGDAAHGGGVGKSLGKVEEAHDGTGKAGSQRASANLGTTEAPGESCEGIRSRGPQFNLMHAAVPTSK